MSEKKSRAKSSPIQPSELQAGKIKKLVAEHGSIVNTVVQQGRLPIRQIGNFFGRHSDRRNAILSAMKNGMSYSKAYEQSKHCFDTKRWSKIPARTASCRGLLLKTIAELVANGVPISWTPQAKEQAVELSCEFAHISETLIRHIVAHDAVRPPKSPQAASKPAIELEGELSAAKLSNLKTAITKLRKNTRDLPQMYGKLGQPPSLDDVAHTIIEATRIKTGAPLLIAALQTIGPSTAPKRAKGDLHGVGTEYATWLNGLSPGEPPAARIATHKSPDADALVSTWLADRFLFPNVKCQIDFVPRDFDPLLKHHFDAVLDVGKNFDRKKLIFDHKPPAFIHRDEHCATSLVWQHAQSLGCDLDHLQELVDLVHDGDAATRRTRSKPYQQSLATGLHALIKAARARAPNDQMLYQSIASYLDAHFLAR